MTDVFRDRQDGTMIRLITALLLFATAGLASACTATADPPTPTTEPPKSADAARFPNMDNYTPVNPHDYMWQTENPGRPNKMTTYGFRTPDGIGCTYGQSPSASCAGNNLPSIPSVCDSGGKSYGSNEISTDIGLRQVGMPCENSSAAKILPPFHTLTVYDVTCGVDDKGTTACKDPQGRAFVLSPAWSGWIPKV